MSNCDCAACVARRVPSPLEQSLDDMLYAAYIDGREDEREDMRRVLIECADGALMKERGIYTALLMQITAPVKTEQIA